MSSPRIVVLDGHTTDLGDDAIWDGLRGLGDVRTWPRSSPEEARARVADAEAVLINKVRVDATLLRAAPRLRYVGVLATGHDCVDKDAARAHGAAVTNVPGYSTESVAQLVFAHLLHLENRVAEYHARVRAGDWSKSGDFCFFLNQIGELHGRTLLVLGMGAIGGAVARIAGGFGMRVLAGQVPGRSAPGRVPLEEALPQADAITLHCPLTDATRHLVGAGFLARCRPGAILVNTGRGALIDEAALLEALDSGRLRAACIDVLATEPPPDDHPLLHHPRAVVTPHVGWGSVEARRRLVREATANLAAFTRGERRNRVD